MPPIERLMLDNQPEPVSHYCHVTKAGNLVWVSGTVGIASDGRIPEDVVEQFEVAIANMDACLKAAGGRRRARGEGDRIPDRCRRSHENQSDPAALLRPAPPGLHSGRGRRPGPSGTEGRDRGAGSRLVAGPTIRVTKETGAQIHGLVSLLKSTDLSS